MLPTHADGMPLRGQRHHPDPHPRLSWLGQPLHSFVVVVPTMTKVPRKTRRSLRMTHGGPVAQVPAAQVPTGAYLLDVREPEEWEAGHVPGAVHIPLGELGARYTELEQDRPLYVICRSGNRSGHAARALAGAGWDASNVSDGMIGWHAAGLPMTAESGQPYVA